MTETKYTKDGRKVAVLGKLNSEEYIVQEIFVSNGQEIPGGENFTAKGLLDAPAESWKEADLRKREGWHKRRVQEIERDEKRLSERQEKAQALASALFDFAKGTEHEAEIQTLVDFLAGNITHFYIDKYTPKIVAFDDEMFYEDYGRIKGMKLLSLFGSSKGHLSYQVNGYPDGSGSNTRIYPFASYEAALAHAQTVCNEQAAEFVSGEARRFNAKEWEKIDGIQIPVEARAIREARDAETRKEKIAKLKAEIAKLEET